MIDQLIQITAQSRNKKIGLLGGSFNPAHLGHIQISIEAKKRLGLDEIWWLITPQNPLKSKNNQKSQQQRAAQIKTLNLPKFIKLCSFERHLNALNSHLVLVEIEKRGKLGKFVWIMGADNLSQIPKWKHWQRIFQTIPICVMDRSGNNYASINSIAAQKYKPFQNHNQPNMLIDTIPPAWAFIKMPRINISSTELRKAVTNLG